MAKLSDDVMTYMQEHNVSVLLEHLTRKLAENMPNKPSQYICELLSNPVPQQIIISGPPGSGKGTQCKAIVDKFNLVHISSGDILRAEVQKGTDNGKIAESFMKNGELVPDALMIGIVRRRLEEDDVRERGWLMDGFPRTKVQAEALEADGIVPHLVLQLDVPDETVIERIALRRVDPVTGNVYHMKYNPPPANDLAVRDRLITRSDDYRETVEERIKIYHNNQRGVLEYYKSLVEMVDGDKPLDEVTVDVLDVVDKRRVL